MRVVDVAVVGGGPAGAVAAREAAERGASVLLVERRSEFREPTACGGLVSPRVLSVLRASDACVVRRVRAARLHAPGGGTLALRAPSDRGLVLDRPTLERELLANARAAGVEVLLGAEAVAWDGGSLTARTDAGAERVVCRTLIGADGPESRVALWAGLLPGRAFLAAAQAEVDVEPDADEVGIYVGRDVAPGFFAWSIPAQPGRVRVGTAVPTPGDPGPHLERLLASRFAAGQIAARVEAAIPIPRLGDPIARDNVFLTGDAAGHVKPLSGGGLYFGGLCGRLAGRAAAEAARDPEARDRACRRYQDACRKLLEDEVRFGAMAGAARDALQDEDWDRLVALLARPDLVAVVERHLDLDHLRALAARLMSHPRLWPTLFEAWSLVQARAAGVAELRDALL